MKFSEFSGKEIVHIENGKRLGVLGQMDLVFDEHTGEIHSVIIPRSSFLPFRKQKKETIIYWTQIKTIGPDIILVDNRSNL